MMWNSFVLRTNKMNYFDVTPSIQVEDNMFYFGLSLVCLVYKTDDLCLPVKQFTVQTQGEEARKGVF